MLAIDDQPDGVLAVLTRDDVFVHLAYTAEEALAALVAWTPDVVTLDLGVGGEAFAQRIRRAYAGRLVIASAADPQEIYRVAALVGAHAVPKPYLALDLRRAVFGDSL